GSLDGVMNRWIDVLTLFSRKEVVRDDLFLAPLYTFLTTPEVDLCHLASAWKQTCDVSPEFMADKVSPLKAMRCVNSFRNRFAHVPFPHDQIVSVSRALTALTDDLFAIEPVPRRPGSVLSGAIRYLDACIHGTRLTRGVSASEGEPAYEFSNSQKESDHWSAVPFAFVDEAFRPYVLTRVVDTDQGTLEFTRFRAETRPVIEKEEMSWLSSFPRPSPG